MNKIENLKAAVASADVDAINVAKAELNIMDGSMLPDSLVRDMKIALNEPCFIDAPVEDIKSNGDCIPMVDTDDDGRVDSIDSDNDGRSDKDDFAPDDPEVQDDPDA